jgi:arsenate reductase
MAEAMLRHVAGDRFEVRSAGSHPAGFIHPLALETLDRLKIPVVDQWSKSWDEFAGEPFDAVITLCDHAAARPCPAFAGPALRVHWPLPDPVFHPGSDEERARFALSVAERLRAKIEGLLLLDWTRPRPDVQRRLDDLGSV